MAPALCDLPDGWVAFSTQDECQTDCRCQSITDHFFERFNLPDAHESLACACSRQDCAMTLEEELARRCPDGGAGNVTLARGCGKVEIADGPNLGGTTAVFDEASGRLIGRTEWGDTIALPCLAVSTISGTEFACPEATICQLCGGGDVPHCN